MEHFIYTHCHEEIVQTKSCTLTRAAGKAGMQADSFSAPNICMCDDTSKRYESKRVKERYATRRGKKKRESEIEESERLAG